MNLILAISLLINIGLGIQYYQHTKQANITLTAIANRTLFHIKGVIDSTTNPDADWDNTSFKVRVANEIRNAELVASLAEVVGNVKNDNLSEIQYNLNIFAGILSSQITMELESLGSEMPLTEKDRKTLIKLGRSLQQAGFTQQVREDNGEDFKNSLKKFISNY